MQQVCMCCSAALHAVECSLGKALTVLSGKPIHKIAIHVSLSLVHYLPQHPFSDVT